MLETKFNGGTMPHRLLWQIVEEQAQIANSRDQEWSRPALVAMVFSFLTVESYINFVGERLEPKLWADERNAFRKEGVKGKIRKVFEVLDIPWDEDGNKPLKTVLELKDLRDAISHSKPEKLSGKITHDESESHPFPASSLRSMFTPKEKLSEAIHGVEHLLNEIHSIAREKIDDVWFGVSALHGPDQYNSRDTRIVE